MVEGVLGAVVVTPVAVLAASAPTDDDDVFQVRVDLDGKAGRAVEEGVHVVGLLRPAEEHDLGLEVRERVEEPGVGARGNPVNDS